MKEVMIFGMCVDKETGDHTTAPYIEDVEHWDVTVVERDSEGNLVDEVECVENLADETQAETMALMLSKKHNNADITAIL